MLKVKLRESLFEWRKAVFRGEIEYSEKVDNSFRSLFEEIGDQEILLGWYKPSISMSPALRTRSLKGILRV
jgi:hypothetical protein